jgi:hypothetical protein
VPVPLARRSPPAVIVASVVGVPLVLATDHVTGDVEVDGVMSACSGRSPPFARIEPSEEGCEIAMLDVVSAAEPSSSQSSREPRLSLTT